ncbi:hypothetical protein QN362_13840 [Actimicrobium sp. CCC2.4]|uniref:hypothetical protein n=1 Tax=Actimicrobium sp. CCC2.4 TaxID=3048606 RepID=UPI002AC9AF57|nr:hypothetical protein [Actimicrobium sp. CCC2.4]MEB0136417.1 hypothetical protein [Actimicrobium sp. CCC2.4]WPX31236.1 hypothetical protein RHM62_13395 [Actimicrobium sp. CCC2.4]
MPICLTAVVLAASLSGTASAAESSATSAGDRYQAERAVCLSGQSNQSEATCLKEAGAARDEALRHQLGDGNASYDANAMRRCAALPPADKRDCESRIRGEGSVSGSVRDGGLIRETTTIVPADSAR